METFLVCKECSAMKAVGNDQSFLSSTAACLTGSGVLPSRGEVIFFKNKRNLQTSSSQLSAVAASDGSLKILNSPHLLASVQLNLIKIIAVF